MVTIVQGVLNDKKPADLKDKMHPLGVFDGLFVMMTDTSIGPCFDEFLKMAEIDAENEAPRAGYQLEANKTQRS